MYGYTGKMLFVNLSDGSIEKRELSEQLARDFIGGPALGAKILYNEMPAKADVFGPDSMIGFVGGPLNDSRAFFGGRYTVVSKSPVYGGFNDANSGGYFGSMLKRSGYDAIFIKGISEKPVYILVNKGEVRICDASHLWGKTIKETEAILTQEFTGTKLNAAIIGPAGEKLSHMAAVMNDGHRAAARGGSGAVMGSKMLKAVVVQGDHKVEVFDKSAVSDINKDVADTIKNGPMAQMLSGMQVLGTAMPYIPSCMNGDAAVKNWTSSGVQDYPEEAANATSPVNYDSCYKTKKYACSACPIGCGAIYDVKEGRWQIEHTSRPEYETLAAFGSNLLNRDHESILMCNEICNENGLDTISAGGTVAWAMDCYNRGILSRDDLDGIDLSWGDGGAVVELMEKIARGEGCGRKLINGSLAAANAYGKGFECLAVASGIEPGQHDPRLAKGAARAYKYDPTPGRHVKVVHMLMEPIEPPYKGTGYKDVMGACGNELTNNSGLCSLSALVGFPGMNSRYINAVTGFNLSPQDLLNIGLRSLNIRNAFNLREGLRRKDYTMSEVIYKAPAEMTGPLAGVDIDVELLAENAFNVLGWDMEMVPDRSALEMLGGMDEVIADLYPAPAGSVAL